MAQNWKPPIMILRCTSSGIVFFTSCVYVVLYICLFKGIGYG